MVGEPSWFWGLQKKIKKSKVSGYAHFEMKPMLVKIWKFCTRLRRELTWHTANTPELTVHNSLLVLRTNFVYLHNNQACIAVSERHDWCVDVVTVSVQHGVVFDAPGGGAFSNFLTQTRRWLVLAGLAFEFDHHDGDVVGATAVEGLEDDALGAEMRLVQALPDEANGLFVAEGVPQPVRRQDHELRLQLVQVKGHDVGIGDDHVEVFQGVVAERAWHGQDALDSPGTVETNEASWESRRNVRWRHLIQTVDQILLFSASVVPFSSYLPHNSNHDTSKC